MRTGNRESGLVVLDTNCFKYLDDVAERTRILRSLRAVDLTIWPSALNVVQLASWRNVARRNARFATLKNIAGNRPLLPWPYDILKRVGEAIQSGEPGFRTGQSGVEWVVDQLPLPSDPKVVQALKTLKAMDQAFDQAHTTARPKLQAMVKKGSPWKSPAEFLDNQWTRPEQVDTLIEIIWKQLQLSGAPPVTELLESESWRLLIDGFGVSIYLRSVLKQQAPFVELTDMVQLVYLGGRPRRILVSEDKDFVAAASAVVNHRYPGAYVYGWKDFAAKHNV